MTNGVLDISVLIATHNRAEILRRTLQSMTRLDLEGISVEFVLIDNNSSDNTRQVIESFRTKLPIRYLFEPRPGQNCARNRALADVQLGSLVAFTDDDIEADRNWLRTIFSAARRWPNHSVFGGTVYPILPRMNIPKWAQSPVLQRLCFSAHRYGDSEGPYSERHYPISGNFWVRREVFANGRRFDEAIGPRPGKYVMGSETLFLMQLAEEGYGMIYSPHAVVGHRIQPWQVSVGNILRRGFRGGAGYAYLLGLPRPRLLERHPLLWYVPRSAAVLRSLCALALSVMSLSLEKQIIRSRLALASLGYNLESLRVARKARRDAARERQKKV
jgi:glycosyltransferase involved in cell wall biosynthesis